jgi:SAM-dependent methyltransferase
VTSPARRFVALAFADELLAHPELLAEYGRTFGADDAATLAIFAPDGDANEIAEALGAQADIDADLLLLAVPADQDEEIAAGVDCLYSRRLPTGAFRSLVRVDDSRAQQLRAIAEDRWGVAPPPVEPPARLLPATYHCNVCGAPSDVALTALDREKPSCAGCGSTPRWRSVVHALSLGLFGRSMPISEFPTRADLKGVGLSDWPGYAIRFAEKLGYENTYLHQEPFLDIADVPADREGTLDFVVSSEVFEHVAPPISRAFVNARRLLRPGGVLVLTVPYADSGETAEHFPELHDWKIVGQNGDRRLVNRTADGRVQEFGDLVFHGGDGSTLEMRRFAVGHILRELDAAGFVDVEVVPLSEEFGVWWNPAGSRPIIARVPERAAAEYVVARLEDVRGVLPDGSYVEAPAHEIPPALRERLERPAEAGAPQLPVVFLDGYYRSPRAAAVSPSVSETMKREWNERARENAMHYIASAKDEWETDEFYASGVQNIRQYVRSELDFLTRGRDASTLRALDIGCGMGRLTRALGAIFGEAHGVDVSGEMVARGNAQLAAVPNVRLHETNGVDFALFEDASFDFAFSFIVFQHVPSREAVVSNLREAHRVLKPGSMFKFQVQGSRDPNYLAAPKDTWLGVSFSEEELRELADEIGFDVLRGEGAGTQYFWQWWRKRS